MRTAMIIMQQLAYEWAIRCFGMQHVLDQRVRALRLVEEAIECAQSLGVDRASIYTCTNVVYERPHGKPGQEIGGVMVTAAVLAQTLHTDIETQFMDELQRVLSKPPAEFATRNQQKVDAGLSGKPQSKGLYPNTRHQQSDADEQRKGTTMGTDYGMIRAAINKLSEMVRHQEQMTPEVEMQAREALNAVDRLEREHNDERVGKVSHDHQMKG